MPDDHLDSRLSDYNHMNGGLETSRVHTSGPGIFNELSYTVSMWTIVWNL